MRRSGSAVLPLLLPALIHVHVHRAQSFDYLGLGVAAFASWVGLPGPGEPLLLAAAVLAAKHRLDLIDVLLVAFAGAVSGGIAGWAIGVKLGRAVATAPGPLRTLRIRVVQRGEAIFERHPVLAILMTPAVVAGIHRVRAWTYQAVNVASAAAWTLAIGVGGYFIGPPVLDAVSDLGTALTIAAAAVLGGIVVLEVRRRVRRLSR